MKLRKEAVENNKTFISCASPTWRQMRLIWHGNILFGPFFPPLDCNSGDLSRLWSGQLETQMYDVWTSHGSFFAMENRCKVFLLICGALNQSVNPFKCSKTLLLFVWWRACLQPCHLHMTQKLEILALLAFSTGSLISLYAKCSKKVFNFYFNFYFEGKLFETTILTKMSS